MPGIKLRGLSIESIKKHPSLIPLYVIMFTGLAGATFYSLRVALRNPEISWSHKRNPEPFQEYRNKTYKFYLPGVDSSKIKCEAPEY